MPEPETCLSMDHINIPDDAAVVIYARQRGPRPRYTCITMPDLHMFKALDLNIYRDEMLLAFERDRKIACSRCDAVFEAHEAGDVSAWDQLQKHRKAVHP